MSYLLLIVTIISFIGILQKNKYKNIYFVIFLLSLIIFLYNYFRLLHLCNVQDKMLPNILSSNDFVNLLEI